MLSDLQQRLRESMTSSSIETVPPPPNVADLRHDANVQPIVAHEQREIIDWHHQQLAKDQEDMPGAPLSLDVEEIHCTLMDILHLTGQRPHQGDRVQLHNKPGRGHESCGIFFPNQRLCYI